MKKRSIGVALAAIVAVSSCRLTTAPEPVGQDDFSAGALAHYSAYSDEGYPWSLGQNVLQGNGFGLQSVLIRNSVSIRDGWVEMVADSLDDGGLVMRFSNNENYYLLAIRDDEAPFPRNMDNLQIYRRTGLGQGGFESLWRMDVTWPRGVAHQVRFETSRDSLRVYFDARLVGAIGDGQHLSGGGIGVRHYGNSESWITRYRRLRWGYR